MHALQYSIQEYISMCCDDMLHFHDQSLGVIVFIMWLIGFDYEF